MTYWIITIVLVAIALAIIAVVGIGMNPGWTKASPELSALMTTTARHLNGEADPPKGLVEIVEGLPDLLPRSASSGSEPPKR